MATSLLTARTVETVKKPGRHADGGNLYLNVTATGAKSWVFMFKRDGKQREMGLGSVRSVSLAEARKLAGKARDHLHEGKDPLAERSRPAAVVMTFGACADAFIEAKQSGWRNDKHRAQWRMTLTTYAADLRGKPVHEILSEDVLRVLKPIWQATPETASRLRGRIEAVLDYAKTRGFRTGENPAAWRGNLKHVLPDRSALSRGHHEAMAIDDVPAFMTELRAASGLSARALEFTILTAARSGEVLGAQWGEFNADLTVWTIPAIRMKAGKEHRVPLPSSAAAILRDLQAVRLDRYGEVVFPGQKAGLPLSNMAMEMTLRRLKRPVTVHGFRSSFRDWASERTNFPSEVCEKALAHTIVSKVEAAYRRSDLLDKRRPLMDAWAAFCGGEAAANVLPFRAA